MKRLLQTTLLIGLFLAVGSYVSAETVKLGSVDLIRALNECEEGKKAKNDLEFMIQSKQTTLNEKGQTIEKLRADLEKQASVLSADARKTKEDELERLIRDYQRLVQDSQNEVKKREGEFTARIIKDLRKLIERMGKEDGYSMIIENADGIVLYAKDEFDITDQVIKKYNEMKAKEKSSKAKDNDEKSKEKK